MKKLFIFALAAATMAVSCQKLQGLGNDNTPVDDTTPVEIKFGASAEVETKAAVSSLEGLALKVYALNTTSGKRQIEGADAEFANPYLTLDGGPYFYNNNTDVYNFYGYYLGGLETEVGTGYVAEVTITGEQDILLAKAESDGETSYTATAARNDTHPNLHFEHALAQFTFNAVNLGSTNLTLSAIKVRTQTVADVTVAGAGQGVAPKGTTADVAVAMAAKEITPGSEADVDEDGNFPSVNATPVMVYAGSTYDFYFTLTQGSVERTLKVALTGAVEAGNSYAINIKLYSLEEIKISATLAEWESKSYTVDTDSAVEVTPDEEDPDQGA